MQTLLNTKATASWEKYKKKLFQPCNSLSNENFLFLDIIRLEGPHIFEVNLFISKTITILIILFMKNKHFVLYIPKSYLTP